MEKAKTLHDVRDYALTFFGLPYVWGGDGTPSFFGGYDCSGLVQRILGYAGVDPKGDQSADGLYRHFLKNGLANCFGIGALAFFGNPEHIHHVGWCLDKKVMINASGGGSHIKTVEIAKRMNASVKIEPIHFRKDFVACIMPFYHMGLET
jgi:cell wall-associated NlpC family hydrolase